MQRVALLIRSNRKYQTINRRQPQQCGPGDVYVIRWYEDHGRKTRYLNVGTRPERSFPSEDAEGDDPSQPQDAKVPEKAALGLSTAIEVPMHKHAPPACTPIRTQTDLRNPQCLLR